MPGCRLIYLNRPYAVCRDGGGVIAQKLYHNFKQFRIYDLSDHKVNNFHLLVRGVGEIASCLCKML